MSFSSYLITPSELASSLKSNSSTSTNTSTSRIIPLCASWFLPNDPQKRTGHQTFLAQRIPNARFFDLDAIKDNDSPYPHMLPSAADFAHAMGKLGIKNEDTVVVYDTKELGIFSAPRVGWTLRVFGHERVHVLNNFKLWVEEGYPTESGEPEDAKAAEYKIPSVRDQPSQVLDFEFIKDFVTKPPGSDTDSKFTDATILDARPAGRFTGTDPEPRPGLPSGHMPRSKSVPFSDMLDPKTKTLLPAEQLKQLFKDRRVDLKKPVISSCGTGVTAAVIDAALAEVGVDGSKRYLYYGSWTEYAQRAGKEDGLIVNGQA